MLLPVFSHVNVYCIARHYLFLQPYVNNMFYAEFQNSKLMRTRYKMSEVDAAKSGHPRQMCTLPGHSPCDLMSTVARRWCQVKTALNVSNALYSPNCTIG